MTKNSKGFSAVAVLIILVVATTIALTGFYVYKADQDNSENANETETSGDIESGPIKPGSNKVTVTPQGGTPFELLAPEGWTSNAFIMQKDIDGISYIVSFGITEYDYLKANPNAYNPTGKVFSEVVAKNGNRIYTVELENDIGLSACEPSPGKGCSLVQNGKPLLIRSYAGSKTPGLVDFSEPSAAELINDLRVIASSIDL